MTTIYLRSTEGSPLTHTKVDDNFTNLNNDKCGTTTSTDGETNTAQTGNVKTTTVVSAGNKKYGTITMDDASLAAHTAVSFSFTNTSIAATDLVVLNHDSGGTLGNYALNARAEAGSASISITNLTASALTDAVVLRFAVIKATAG
tara:strand:- start:217 stop:654 length:438 start_codon:yes stop_codon:yes gene_type:complete